MKKLLVLVVVFAILAACQAFAAQESITVYPCMPGCCTFDCVQIDLTCGYCCDSATPLTIEFLDGKQNVLGTGSIVNWCCDAVVARLDKSVDSNQVCAIRLTKDAEGCCVSWASIRVLCGGPCTCGKWVKVFKGDLWCWEPVKEAAPAPAPEPEAAPAPAPVHETAPAPAPEPEQSFEYFPPQEDSHETMTVEGRG
jgi:hypothetical protein